MLAAALPLVTALPALAHEAARAAVAHTSALPTVPSATCPGGDLDPVCGVTSGLGSTLAADGTSAVLGAVTSWVVGGATWLLDQVGAAISATTSVDVGAAWFGVHYRLMEGLLAVVVLPMILGAVITAVYRQSADVLVRSVLVHLPLAMILTGAALQLVQMGLGITDALSSVVASGSGSNLNDLLSVLAKALRALGTASSFPAFVVLLGALLIAAGAFALWAELLVRAAAVYVAVLFLPMALATLVWPAVSHWCRRLLETLVALILSKFVMVAILSLALGALNSATAPAASGGGSFASVLAGGALLLLAAFSPFALLRLVPMVEAGAALQLEGARHRVTHALTSAPRSAASLALAASGVGGSLEGALAGGGAVGSLASGGVAMVAGGTEDVPVGPAPGGAGGGAGSGAGSGPAPPDPPAAAGVPAWRGSGSLTPDDGAPPVPPPGPFPDQGAGDDVRPAPAVMVPPVTTGRPARLPNGRPGAMVPDHDRLGITWRWVPDHAGPLPDEGEEDRGALR